MARSAEPLVQRSVEVLGGEAVFDGMRVPVQTLFDYVKAGDRLDGFPTVSRDQAIAALDLASDLLAGGNANTP